MTRFRLFLFVGMFAVMACDPVEGVPREYGTEPEDTGTGSDSGDTDTGRDSGDTDTGEGTGNTDPATD